MNNGSISDFIDNIAELMTVRRLPCPPNLLLPLLIKERGRVEVTPCIVLQPENLLILRRVRTYCNVCEIPTICIENFVKWDKELRCRETWFFKKPIFSFQMGLKSNHNSFNKLR